ELLVVLARYEDVFDLAEEQAAAAKATEAAGKVDDEMQQYRLALDQAVSEIGDIFTKCFGSFNDTKLYGANLQKARLP
ncbi:unnamed protein product, partial [Symbiodinium sp. CCMP2456]